MKLLDKCYILKLNNNIHLSEGFEAIKHLLHDRKLFFHTWTLASPTNSILLRHHMA